MATTYTLQKLVNEVRSYPECTPVLGASGFAQYPALSIANDTFQRLLAQGLNWKWNRSYIPPIVSVALQQDYPTQITDLGWLESADKIDINNSTNNGNTAPKPIFTMESVRNLPRTSTQSQPFQMAFVPNTLAYLGQWFPNTAYGCGYGVAQVPITPIQSFLDANGNILYIDSTVLGLNISSPGFTGIPITLPAGNPYGVSGNVQPVLPPNSAAGTTTMDGTVRWTVADPNGYAIRVSPLPAYSSLCWLMEPIYQRKPPILTSLQQPLAPVPDDCISFFRSGFLAGCYSHASSPKAVAAYAKWEEDIAIYLRSGDREAEENIMYPSESLTGGGTNSGIAFGPAWPYSIGPGW